MSSSLCWYYQNRCTDSSISHWFHWTICWSN